MNQLIAPSNRYIDVREYRLYSGRVSVKIVIALFNERMMDLQYAINEHLELEDVVGLLRRSQATRSEGDARRLVRIVPEANVVVSVRDGARLVGLARGLKEMSGCCYLSDLLVDKDYQKMELGGEMIRRVRQLVGDKSLIVLVPAPGAMAYRAEISS